MERRVVGLCGIAAGVLAVGLAGVPGVPAYAGSAAVPAPMAHGGTLSLEVYDPVADDDAIWLVDGDGTRLRQLTDPGFEEAHWSPDGTKLVAAGDFTAGIESWIIDPATGDMRSLTEPDPDLASRCFTWSPDGSRLGCEAWDPTTSDPVIGGEYSARASDGADLTQVAPAVGLDGDFGSFSPDGASIVYDNQDTDTDRGLFTAAVDASNIRRLTPRSMYVQSGGDFSPDGRWIAFSARKTIDVRQSIWLVRPDGTHLHQVRLRETGGNCGGSFADPDSFGCSDPTWSPDGRFLAYRHNTPDGSEVHLARVSGGHVSVLTRSPDNSFDVEYIDWGPYFSG
jgi:Tol biopolymer transport system component